LDLEEGSEGVDLELEETFFNEFGNRKGIDDLVFADIVELQFVHGYPGNPHSQILFP
jgi:hypothetical protein